MDGRKSSSLGSERPFSPKLNAPEGEEEPNGSREIKLWFQK